MGCWFGALALQTIKNTVGLGDTAPRTIPISKAKAAKLTKNSTEFIFDHFHNSKLVSLSDQSIWSGMTPFRNSLSNFSPDLDSWLSTMYQSGRLKFQDFSNEESHTTRLARFDFHSNSLLLFPGFFSQTDAQKILILRHERFHAGEDMIDLIVTHGAPLAGIGTISSKVAKNLATIVNNTGSTFIEPTSEEMRRNRIIAMQYYDHQVGFHRSYRAPELTPRQQMINSSFELSNFLSSQGEQGSFAYNLMYYNNRSERAARRYEEETRQELGIPSERSEDEHTISQKTASFIPEHSEAAVGFVLGAGSILGARKRLKKIKKIISDSKKN
jgi:hypothetical protein